MENLLPGHYFVAGVDIGGSHITAAIIDISNKVVLPGTKVRHHVNSHGTCGEIIGAWVSAIEEVMAKSPVPVQSIGFAMPGPFDYKNGVCLMKNMHKYDALFEVNIKGVLAEKLSLSPSCITFRNDAEAFLEGEVVGGAASGYAHAIGLTLGTGMGSARSHSGLTEDVNHGSSPFLEGITEDYISTRWFIKRYHELTGDQVKDAREVALLTAYDPKAKQVFDEFSTNLGNFLHGFIAAENPEIVILGGNIANASPLFLPGLEAKLKPHYPHISIEIAVLGEDAALMGAVSSFEPIFRT